MPTLPQVEQTVFSTGRLAPQDIRVDPNAFGASVGQSLEQASNTLSQTALLTRGLQNEKAATDSVNGLDQQLNALKVDYYNQYGDHAVAAHTDTTQQAQQIFDAQRGVLNPAARRMFDAVGFRILRGHLNDIDSHYSQQFKTSLVDTSTSRIATAGQSASLSYNNPQRIEENLQAIDMEVVKRADFLGLSPESAAKNSFEERSKALWGVVQGALDHNDTGSAEAIIRHYQDQIDPHVLGEMERAVRMHQDTAIITQEHARTLANQTREDNDRKLYDGWLSKLQSNQLAPDDVLQSNASPNVKEHVLQLIEHKDKEADTPVKTDPKTFTDLFSRIHTDGPGKLENEQALNQAFVDGKVSFADLQRLNKEFRDARTPGGQTLANLRSDFTHAYRRTLDRTELGEADPEGPQQWYLYNRYIDSRVADYRQQGKDPVALFDPSGSDFVGKALPMFQRTPQQILASKIAAAKATPVGAAPPAAVEYLKTHPETKDQFKAKFGYLPDDAR